ncbi:MAG TPA: hypothetical protein VFY29_20870 [Terriglobia bacterium]|nr:hypothetical protein [Terriglobia bacterium]
MTKQRVATLAAEANARNNTGTALRGDPIPGNGWDDYRLALGAAAALNEQETWKLLSGFMDGSAEADRRRVEQLLLSNTTILAYLQRGVRRSSGHFAYEWQKETVGAIPLSLRTVELLAAVQVRLWLEAGRTEEALDLLIDMCAFARDIGLNATSLNRSWAIGLYELALDEMRMGVQSGVWRRSALDRLERELEFVDREFPALGPSFVNDALIEGAHFVQVDEQQGATPGAVITSVVNRLLFARAFFKLEAAARQFENCDRRPFEEVKADLDRFAHWDPITASVDPIVIVNTPIDGDAVYTFRGTLTRLRILETAIRYLQNGQTVALDDPFGDKLIVSTAGGKLRVSSVGPDGKDNRGNGEWRPILSHNGRLLRFAEGKDIVMEVALPTVDMAREAVTAQR